MPRPAVVPAVADADTGEAVRPPAVPRPPAMSDVAKLAGVSHQTVSRVLNDHPNVKARRANACSRRSPNSATAATKAPGRS